MVGNKRGNGEIMKRKIMGVMLAVSMAASLVACSKNSSSTSTTSTVNSDISADEYAATITANAAIYKNYLTLNSEDYLDQEIELDTSSYEVTDDDVNEQLEALLEQLTETEYVYEGETKEGDVINLDYSGTLDGVAFSGGTATSVSYTVGSGKFIDDLDQGLIGLTVGETYDIPCTFPSDYSSSDLAGKDVIFTVTVNYIEEDVVPDLTDEWVAANASTLGYDDCTTVEELTAAVRSDLEATAKSSLISAKYSAIYALITEDLEVTDYPEDELNQLLDTLNDNIEAEFDTYGTYYGITDLETYITTVYGFDDMDAFNEYAEEYAKSYLLEKMIITIIAADNDITVTADEINETGEELADYYGYDDYDAILSEYGNEMNAEIGYQCLYTNVTSFLADHCTVVATSE